MSITCGVHTTKRSERVLKDRQRLYDEHANDVVVSGGVGGPNMFDCTMRPNMFDCTIKPMLVSRLLCSQNRERPYFGFSPPSEPIQAHRKWDSEQDFLRVGRDPQQMRCEFPPWWRCNSDRIQTPTQSRRQSTVAPLVLLPGQRKEPSMTAVGVLPSQPQVHRRREATHSVGVSFELLLAFWSSPSLLPVPCSV